MSLLRNALLICLLPVLVAGCSGSTGQFVLEPAAPTQKQRLKVGSVELAEVSLPTYAAASEIVIQDADGALREVGGAVWADDPVRGVTLALVRNLSEISSARVASEPWPLEQPADVRVDVRVERMLARMDGTFVLSGQFAVAAPEEAVRESLTRFEIVRPLTGFTAAEVAQATGSALSGLAAEIAARLRR